MGNRIKLSQTVIVEGKCDLNVLNEVIDANIIILNGFGIYKDKEKLSLIKRYARANDIILLTDSDNAGRQLRSFIADSLNGICEVYHAYIPQSCNSPEVEDAPQKIIRNLFEELSERVLKKDGEHNANGVAPIYTRERLFDDGFIGGKGSSLRRKALLKHMDLPKNLSVNRLIDVLNTLDNGEYESFNERIKQNSGIF